MSRVLWSKLSKLEESVNAPLPAILELAAALELQLTGQFRRRIRENKSLTWAINTDHKLTSELKTQEKGVP